MSAAGSAAVQPPGHILVVEDEVKVARFLAQGLGEEGHEVDVAGSAAAARELIEGGPERDEYDLIVLDWMLPDGDGLDLARGWRQRGMGVPVLMLTARDSVTDRIAALDAGADDYLPKPFAFAELLARVRALLRRSQGRLAVARLAELEIDLLNRLARWGGAPLPLTGKEFSVLAYLLRHGGRVVSRAELLQQVWSEGDAPVTANVVDVQIARLRDKLSAAGAPPLIHTVRRQGYAVSLTPPEGASPPPAPPGKPDRP